MINVILPCGRQSKSSTTGNMWREKWGWLESATKVSCQIQIQDVAFTIYGMCWFNRASHWSETVTQTHCVVDVPSPVVRSRWRCRVYWGLVNILCVCGCTWWLWLALIKPRSLLLLEEYLNDLLRNIMIKLSWSHIVYIDLNIISFVFQFTNKWTSGNSEIQQQNTLRDGWYNSWLRTRILFCISGSLWEITLAAKMTTVVIWQVSRFVI